MNTVIEQKWYGESADTVYTGMETKIREIESVLSLHLSQSEIASINENAGVQPVEVSQPTFDLLQRAKELSEQSDGAIRHHHRTGGGALGHHFGSSPCAHR